MATQTGRTVKKWVDFICDDSGATLRSIPVDSIGGVGLSYEEEDFTAFQDAIKAVLSGHPEAPIEITGPFDTTAVQSVGTLSGSHTVLSAIDGLVVPLSLDIQIGVRHAWESGEPQFGITATTANGYICTRYNVDISTMKYSARFNLYPGSAAPAWGTAAET